jgi:glutathione S-transferase
MMQFTLYGVSASPYVRAAAMGLHEKGLSFRMCALGPIESRSAAYLKRHPFGKVPALKPHQALNAWLNRMSVRPSFQNTTPERLLAKAQSRAQSVHTHETQEEIL